MSRPSTLVIAFGSRVLKDGGICLQIADELRRNVKLDIDILELAHGGLDILPSVDAYDKVLFIDILAESRDTLPRLNRFGIEQASFLRHLGSPHFEPFDDVIRAGVILGYSMPVEYCLLGINTDDDLSFGESLSPGLQADMPSIVEEIIDLLS